MYVNYLFFRVEHIVIRHYRYEEQIVAPKSKDNLKNVSHVNITNENILDRPVG